ncbi:hypothetical protein BRADI_1g59290v3 [Brachypodium distachyon]|uniref:non-specific serine/threonine protein kinase n=2 Tax=Brachypodium distachyon TaxID=15368 RepID=I1H4D5_BRADI|nr:hypothetical protein BRADI_1g59290v3 [Brachypodium distachyon]
MASLRRTTTKATATATIFVLHLILAFSSSSSSPDDDDRAALLHLKHGLLSSGSGDGILDHWTPEHETNHCSWPAVRCDARSRRVVALSLRSGRRGSLSPSLSPAVARLTELKSLSMPSLGIVGEIPEGLWRLQNLEVLNLAGNALRGSLPAAFPEGLQILDLSGNHLSGSIPPGIGELGALRVLDLAGNRISGGVPPELRHCGSLMKLDLSENFLHGRVPSASVLKELKNLRFLSLGGNNFSGELPSGLGQMRSLSVLNLSSNYLSGVVPSDLVALRNQTSLLLDNNLLSVEKKVSVEVVDVSPVAADSSVVNPPTGPGSSELFTVIPEFRNSRVLTEVNKGTPSDDSHKAAHLRMIEIAAAASASVVLVIMFVVAIVCICTRKCNPSRERRSSNRREVKVFDGVDIGADLTYEAIVRATGNFNASNCIGSGGFGATYRAEVAPGVLVAIKRLSIGKQQGAKQFQTEVETLGRCRHPNLVTLVGFHISDEETFLIYNYLPGGNLERFIQERTKRQLSWRKLHKIAMDIAHALAFMHDECSPRILHRDVKPSNILLDNDHNAYLSDFGLAKLLRNSQTHATTNVAGTFGYVAPEYAMTCRVSEKADVYSYGVVLLELISDKQALDPSFSPYGDGFNIINWAIKMMQSGRVRGFFIEGLWDKAPHDDLVEILNLGVMCTMENPAARPRMKHVVRRLRDMRPPSY